MNTPPSTDSPVATLAEVWDWLGKVPWVRQFVQVLLINGAELDGRIFCIEGVEWLSLSSEVCVECGLPNVGERELVNKNARVRLDIMCQDCCTEKAPAQSHAAN